MPNDSKRILAATARAGEIARNDDEGEILFRVTTNNARHGDGLVRVTLDEINPRTAGGTPGLPPGVPPRPPTRKLIAGYIEEVVVDSVPTIRLVFDVEVGGNV